MNSGVSSLSTNVFSSFFHLLNRVAIFLRAQDLIDCSLTGFSGSSSGGRVKFCLQLSPKIIFLHIIDIRHLRVFLWLIPLLDADRDLVPNKNPALSRKWVLCLDGFNRFAVGRDCCDLKPFIRAQISLRASSLYRSCARSGGLEKRRKARVN